MRIKMMINMLAVGAVAMGLASCSGQDEPVLKSNVKDARVTLELTVPDQMLDYADITVTYGDNEGAPVVNSTFTAQYDLADLPTTAPIVITFKQTAPMVGSITVDWPIDIDVTVDAVLDGKDVTKTYHTTYRFTGDLATVITNMEATPLIIVTSGE